jgi:hypothetical protein
MIAGAPTAYPGMSPIEQQQLQMRGKKKLCSRLSESSDDDEVEQQRQSKKLKIPTSLPMQDGESRCDCEDEIMVGVGCKHDGKTVAIHTSLALSTMTTTGTTATATQSKKTVRFVPSDENYTYETLARTSYTPQEYDSSFLSHYEQQLIYREIASKIRVYRADKTMRQQQQDQDKEQESLSDDSHKGNGSKTNESHIQKPDDSEKLVVDPESDNESNIDDDNGMDEKYGCLESIIEQRDSDRSARMSFAFTTIMQRQLQVVSLPMSPSSSTKKRKHPLHEDVFDDAWLDIYYRPISAISAKLARDRGIREENAARDAAASSPGADASAALSTTRSSANCKVGRTTLLGTEAPSSSSSLPRSPLNRKLIACC